MNIVLTLTMLLAVLLLPGPLWAQVSAPKASETGEVKITATDLTTAVSGAQTELAGGAREVQVNLGANQVSGFLSAASLTQIKDDLKLKPGQKVEFRFGGDQRIRLRNEDGQLRVRVRDVTLTKAQADTLASGLAAQFGRVEIRARDANGNRIRVEMRDGAIKKDEVKADHKGKGREGTSSDINNENAKDRGKDLKHELRGRERAEHERDKVRSGRHDRTEKPEKIEKRERPEKMERAERSGRH